MSLTITRKLNLAIAAVLILVALVFIIFSVVRTQNSMTDTANEEAAQGQQQTLRILSITDSLMMARVRSSMTLLKESGLALGSPSLDLNNTIQIGDKTVPQLYLGNAPQGKHFELVDHLTDVMGGTATLFVRSGDEYVRATTNVMTPNGRAIGTILAPGGAAIKKINAGDSYYGQVDILGTPYITAYEPMKNAAGDTIGIWYVGYKADLAELQSYLEQSRIMHKGFIALIDNKGRIRSHSDNLSDDEVTAALNNNSDWVVSTASFPQWGYEVKTGYSLQEIAAKNFSNYSTIAIASIIVLAIIMSILSFCIRRAVLIPLRQVSERLKSITHGDGDLTMRFNMNGKDELSQLSQGFDHLLDQLAETINGVKQISSRLHSGCQVLDASANNTHQQISQQTQKTQSVSHSAQEIRQSLSTVSEQIDAVTQTATSAASHVNGTSSKLRHSVDAINTQANEINDAVHVIDELNEASYGIGKVLEVIGSIAEQTNLLALNAAIEAARAGEQGRGFAVVADEVRSLASRTQESTKEIKQMIERLQSDATRAKNQMDRNSERAHQNVTEISSLFEMLESAQEAVQEVNHLSQRILEASTHQQHQVDGVTRDIDDIVGTAGNVQQLADKTTAQSRELISDINQLEQSVSRYRT